VEVRRGASNNTADAPLTSFREPTELTLDNTFVAGDFQLKPSGPQMSVAQTEDHNTGQHGDLSLARPHLRPDTPSSNLDRFGFEDLYTELQDARDHHHQAVHRLPQVSLSRDSDFGQVKAHRCQIRKCGKVFVDLPELRSVYIPRTVDHRSGNAE